MCNRYEIYNKLTVFIVFISVLTGFETCNRYEIFNNMNQQVFFVAEGEHIRIYIDIVQNISLLLFAKKKNFIVAYFDNLWDIYLKNNFKSF